MMSLALGLFIGGFVGLLVAVLIGGSGRASEDERVRSRVARIQEELREISDASGCGRVVIDRGYEVLYIQITPEGLIIDAVPVGDDIDVEALGGWTWDEMDSLQKVN